jgi:NADPH:quinone reductase-like Zn-dependent oxidoreductase
MTKTAQMINAYVARHKGTIDDIEQQQVTAPQVGRDEIRVRVLGSSINPADYKVVTWAKGAGFIHSSRAPICLGYDFSGVVEELGGEVNSIQVGDEVYGFLPYSSKTKQGAYGDAVVVKADAVAPKPESVDHATAATIPTTGATAYQVLTEVASVRPGNHVLINGASGGVGCFAIQIAKHLGATVWGTSSAMNAGFLKSLGADRAVDYKAQDVRALVHSFDVVFDVVSNSSYQAFRHMLNRGGTYITLLPDLGFLRDMILSLFSSKRCKMCIVKSREDTLSELAALVDRGDVRVPVHALYPHTQIREALHAFADGSTQGKIALDFA